MKKIFILIICLLLFVGCDRNKQVINYDNIYCKVMITDENINKIMQLRDEKYFICNNLEKYLAYMTLNSTSIAEVVKEVNVGLYRDYYIDMKSTDLSKNNLILVNKYYYLNNDYVPNDLESITSNCSVGENALLKHDARIQFENMCNDAKKLNLNIYNVSAYRAFSTQENVYKNKLKNREIKEIDSVSARPGNSEHQSGLTLDIVDTSYEFSKTDEYSWLKNNAHKYGFIERYPKDFEKLTGYDWEPWHYRYIGVDAATKIFDENITFDEYYAYYIENNN